MPRTYGAWSWRVRGRSGGTRLGPLVLRYPCCNTITLNIKDQACFSICGINVKEMGFNSQANEHPSRHIGVAGPFSYNRDLYSTLDQISGSGFNIAKDLLIPGLTND